MKRKIRNKGKAAPKKGTYNLIYTKHALQRWTERVIQPAIESNMISSPINPPATIKVLENAYVTHESATKPSFNLLVNLGTVPNFRIHGTWDEKDQSQIVVISILPETVRGTEIIKDLF